MGPVPLMGFQCSFHIIAPPRPVFMLASFQVPITRHRSLSYKSNQVVYSKSTKECHLQSWSGLKVLKSHTWRCAKQHSLCFALGPQDCDNVLDNVFDSGKGQAVSPLQLNQETPQPTYAYSSAYKLVTGYNSQAPPH